MPIYEFACRGCGATFEKRLPIAERLAAQACPGCGKAQGSLVMSVPARVGGGAGESGPAMEFGQCPTTGAPCGCGRAGHHA